MSCWQLKSIWVMLIQRWVNVNWKYNNAVIFSTVHYIEDPISNIKVDIMAKARRCNSKGKPPGIPRNLSRRDLLGESCHGVTGHISTRWKTSKPWMWCKPSVKLMLEVRCDMRILIFDHITPSQIWETCSGVRKWHPRPKVPEGCQRWGGKISLKRTQFHADVSCQRLGHWS